MTETHAQKRPAFDRLRQWLSGRRQPQIMRHLESAVIIGEFEARPYRPNFALSRDYIDTFHAGLAKPPQNGAIIDIGIEGWLRPEDALKLYEGSYFSGADILEVGTYKGLSTFIMATALKNSGASSKIVTIDLSPEAQSSARETLREKGLIQSVDFILNDGESACRELAAEGRKFGFAFVDHSHAYEHVASVCALLPDLMKLGALVAFHDYNDSRNSKRHNVGESGQEYGVMAAIEDTLKNFRFVGVYGCCGVYQRL